VFANPLRAEKKKEATPLGAQARMNVAETIGASVGMTERTHGWIRSESSEGYRSS
jgi:hypothetical protein